MISGRPNLSRPTADLTPGFIVSIHQVSPRRLWRNAVRERSASAGGMWHGEHMVPHFPRPLICSSVSPHDRRYTMVNSRESSPLADSLEVLQAEGA